MSLASARPGGQAGRGRAGGGELVDPAGEAVNALYTLHRPRWHRRRISVWWWLSRWTYVSFVLRELTSVFVALFALVCLWQVWSLAQGPDAYARFLARLRAPSFVLFHLVGLAAVLFHSVTWLNLTPKAMVIRLRGRRVPDRVVLAVNYAAWAVVSLVVAALIRWGG